MVYRYPPVLALACFFFVLPLRAAPLEINVSGLDFIYDVNSLDGPDITDVVPFGGLGLAEDADQVSAMQFEVNGILQGGAPATPYVDFSVIQVTNLALGTMVTSGGNLNSFGFDLLSRSGGGPTAQLLQLDVDTFDIAISTSGFLTASGFGAVFTQNLPFGILIDETQPITIEFSGQISPVPATTATIEAFSVTGGTARILAQTVGGGPPPVDGEVPEPGSITLLALGLSAAAFAYSRRR